MKIVMLLIALGLIGIAVFIHQDRKETQEALAFLRRYISDFSNDLQNHRNREENVWERLDEFESQIRKIETRHRAFIEHYVPKDESEVLESTLERFLGGPR